MKEDVQSIAVESKIPGTTTVEQPQLFSTDKPETYSELVILVSLRFAEPAVAAGVARWITDQELNDQSFGLIPEGEEGEVPLVVSSEHLEHGYTSWDAFHRVVFRAMKKG